MKSYTEMLEFPTYEERLLYLRINSTVGEDTFGSKRYLNQWFYHNSRFWKSVRNQVIIRDNGCDLAIPGLDIFSGIIVHHINPITEEDLLNNSKTLLDPENLVCVSKQTHDSIHYSSEAIMPRLIVRKPNDTCLWKR